jgi:outer membrane lipoprotein SlyB
MEGVETQEAAERRPAGRWGRLSRSHARTALVAFVGAAAGGAYAYFIGCKTGTCPLTSSVWTASVYGALVGGVLGWPNRAR